MNVNEVIQVDDAKWKVLSSDMTEFYEVTKVVTNCECDLRCVECNICVHGFFCTCPDSSIKSNMCKHIHLVQRNSITQETANSERDEENVLVINEPAETLIENAILTDLQNEQLPEDNLEKEKERAMNQFLQLLNRANSKEHLRALKRTLTQTEATFGAIESMQQSATFASTEPPSKRRKIEHQRFYSTKKQKRQTSSSIVVPTAEEKQKIALGFIINH